MYFVEKEDILIEAHILAPERAKLAELTGGGIPVSLSTRVEAIQMMADMCSRFEPKKGAQSKSATRNPLIRYIRYQSTPRTSRNFR